MVKPANDNEAYAAAEAVAVRSRGKLVAYLASRFGDVAAAEDALSEAFAAALTAWPEKGCPDNPEAWLLTAARRKLIDHLRRNRESSSEDEPEQLADAMIAAADDGFPDRRLALLFACAHPAIDPAIRAPLMLQVVLGLEATQIASAFLVSPAAMAQRLVRAKAKIREAGIPFRIPEPDELRDRLESVLDSIYAGFAEGWADATGTDPARRELAGEAIFLGRLLTQLLPDEPEAWGLLALMLYAEARRPARRTAEGEFVPLRSQDKTLWDWPMIEEAEAALDSASRPSNHSTNHSTSHSTNQSANRALSRAKNRAMRIGRYQLEAAIQSAHVEGARTGSVSWAAVVTLYDALAQLTSSPVAFINRALAVAELEGPQAGLAALETAGVDQRVESYQPYWAARANLLGRTGSPDAARHAYQIAIGLESDPAVREYLLRRCDDLSKQG
jgi:RNA polymerase sigma-70 factor, ECF subfamily